MHHHFSFDPPGYGRSKSGLKVPRYEFRSAPEFCAGITNLGSADYLNYVGGAKLPTLVGTTVALGLVPPPEFLALFTTQPADDGTGGTEATGGTYARLQIAGNAAVNAVTAAANATLHFAATPAWIWNGSACIAVGFYCYDATAPSVIPANSWIISATATTVVINNNATGAGVGAADILTFTAFATPVAAAGAEPATVPGYETNAQAVLNFIQSTTNLGTITSAGLYDAVTSGNLRWWDWLGNFAWKPFTGTLASPSVLTVPAHGYSNGDQVVVSAKEGGGSLPTAGSFAGLLTVAGITTDTFNVGVNAATASGSGEIRKVATQAVPSGITVTFPVNQLTLSLG
jgi:hypothetical protein